MESKTPIHFGGKLAKERRDHFEIIISFLLVLESTLRQARANVFLQKCNTASRTMCFLAYVFIPSACIICFEAKRDVKLFAPGKRTKFIKREGVEKG